MRDSHYFPYFRRVLSRCTGAPAPRGIAVANYTRVRTECRAAGRPGAAWPALVDAVARLHAPCERDYGWDVDYAFGSVAIVNARSRDWASFWADRKSTRLNSSH